MRSRNSPATFFALLTLALAPLLPVTAADNASLSGTVHNIATGKPLEGALVELPSLNLSTLTDSTGRYVFGALPAGTHGVVATYLGLDRSRAEVAVAAGSRAVRDFDLTAAIYQLAEYRVTGEREGDAAAITLQRNAPNVKNVVAIDSFGNLPNMSAGELAIRLPGVAGLLDAESNVTSVLIRGAPANTNRVTMDGSLISWPGTLARSLNLMNFTAAMIESLELIKGHTPDKPADSLGGTLNLKTRSTLGMAEKRRVTYNFSARVAPPFTEQQPLREAHPSHPLINFAYQERFDVFGGERNLAVSVNLFYSENVNTSFVTTRDFENTPNEPAFIWDYRTQDNFNNRVQKSASVKFEYRLSPRSKFSLSTIANNADEPYLHNYQTRAFTNQVAGTTATAGVLPGYTSRLTQVRAVAASNIDMQSNMFGTRNRNRHVQFGGEHEFGPLQLDYAGLVSTTHVNRTKNGGAALTNRLTGVGWILDRSGSDLYPSFVQVGGPDIANPANYLPTGTLNDNLLQSNVKVRELRADLRYALPTRLPVTIKTGGQWRQQLVEENGYNRTFAYIGTAPLASDPTFITFDSVKTGRRVPQWQADSVMSEQKLLNPAVWSENVYTREASRFTVPHTLTETVTAGYLMAQGKIARTGWLAGIRAEKTESISEGWVRSRTLSTTAQQLADPAGSAQRDYASNLRELRGDYTKSFPSAHLSQDLTSNLKARLSWSTSFARAPLNNLVPNETINEPNQTLTVNNPGLLPQMAENWDASLDYYFSSVGSLSVGWFHKTITDYIVSGVVGKTIGTGLDNGYGGQYSGFTTLSSANAGTAIVQGWEISYQQQFTFLPGLLKGLSGQVNYTALDTHGDFGGRSSLSNGQVAGFVPRTGNASLAWRHRGFGARVLVNYTGDYLQTYSATAAWRNLYRFKRTITNLGLSYQVRPQISLTCDVSNIFNEPQALYLGSKDRMQSTIINGITITVGLSGRF
jgi:TonB-dependent receptor